MKPHLIDPATEIAEETENERQAKIYSRSGQNNCIDPLRGCLNQLDSSLRGNVMWDC